MRLDRVCIVGPLSTHLAEVRKFLLASGYTRFSIVNRLHWTAQLSCWMKTRRVTTHSLCEAHLQAFVRSRQRFDSRFSRGWLVPVVAALVELKVIRQPKPEPKAPPSYVERAVELYAIYLHEERVLQSAAGQYLSTVKSFLSYRFGNEMPRPQIISADNLTKFVLHTTRRYSISTTKSVVSALRSYVRFLFITGVLAHDLTGAIPAIAGWRQCGLPKGIEPEVLSKLLRAPDRHTQVGRRDYAILILLSRLGLRKKEVTSLRLDDINWQRGEIHIHGKGKKHERLPLPEDVGAALAAHLKNGSRKSSRAIFFSSRPPFLPLAAGSISAIILKAAVQAGLPHIGSHQLRHTLATQMLRRGGSLDEVAQILRHSSHNTTAIYAKVDLNALCTVIQPWPRSVS
jgi:integrase/recombinase XerD